MSEPNREQTKEALKCCAMPKWTKCDSCPRSEEDALCMYRLMNDALSLIESYERIILENGRNKEGDS